MYFLFVTIKLVYFVLCIGFMSGEFIETLVLTIYDTIYGKICILENLKNTNLK